MNLSTGCASAAAVWVCLSVMAAFSVNCTWQALSVPDVTPEHVSLLVKLHLSTWSGLLSCDTRVPDVHHRMPGQ